MLNQIKGLHIEPTNMCTLQCPKCARTEFINQFGQDKWSNNSLDLVKLKQFLDIDLSGKQISLCGTYGDPIYYSNLMGMIEYFKSAGANILIATNGSYRTADWWSRLASILDEQDSIVFGIDGLPETFINYRINADWNSIKIGIDIMSKSKAKLIWQYIPFAFNERDIDEARQLSQNLGFDKFLILPSDRWIENDPLMPANLQLRIEHTITWKKNTNNASRDSRIIDPKCKSNDQHYISANGYYMPCCYISDYRFYYKSEFYKNRSQYNISNTTISQILTSAQSIDFYSTLEDAKLNYCTFNCPKL
jgi:organic radical activating enzyme